MNSSRLLQIIDTIDLCYTGVGTLWSLLGWLVLQLSSWKVTILGSLKVFNPVSRSGVELESQPMRRLGLEQWFLLGGVVRAIRQLHNYEIINLFKIYNHLLPGSLNQQISCCSINNPPYLLSS